ncbi:DEAD/DEAH box helicase family protein [Marispirochaeta sp.]|jgi:type III restriction enzyme|uniref:DEAD/DEAH box helicase n=1 Tax=Marispirochaeta sp. TaxID=2038653 RepID=UPI0029C95CC1|nr:DEAD/DEAH box helicase family protein [Marispirochaeta sp.]
MELKGYQQAVVHDLASFLARFAENGDPAAAYRQHWSRKGAVPGIGDLPDYQEVVDGVPHVCLKVPTAGGKTYIACNSLRQIFESLPGNGMRLVVWLVPSRSILEQTLKNLRDTEHPYRLRLNAHFAGRVEVFSKEEVLQGAGFSPDSLESQLNLVVMSFDSFRATNKEGRKVYQDNENLSPFSSYTSSAPESLEEENSLVGIFSRLNPVIMVDESHNAQTELSIEMLANLNPRFILELTATPRRSSNIISIVNAGALKKENMVKLPVVVYNNGDATEVLQNAVSLRGHLEEIAEEQHESGGGYIRPIVLVQAEPRNAADSETFEKLKHKLIDAGIPEDEIAIKTAKNDELAGVDLLSTDCPVRYIITVNALKEGWDCSFAYILATVSNRSSRVDVEQILGRILRQPYARRQSSSLLNLSYVFTCSNAFHVTLGDVVKGLNRAGFGDKDYRVAGVEGFPASDTPQPELEVSTADEETDPVESIHSERIAAQPADTGTSVQDENLAQITSAALVQEEQYNEEAGDAPPQGGMPFDNLGTLESWTLQSGYPMRSQYREAAKSIALPQFFYKIPGSLILGEEAGETLLDRVHLLSGFRLADKDVQIDFSMTESRVYAIDVDENDGAASPEYRRIRRDDQFYRQFVEYLRQLPIDDLKREVSSRIMAFYRRKDFLNDRDLNRYVQRVLENLSSDQLEDLKQRPGDYVSKITEKIDSLIRSCAEESFRKSLATGDVFLKERWRFPDRIAPSRTQTGIPGALYEKEGDVNSFEHRVINEIADLDSVRFWHRNIERQEFKINAFINHYPDFIVTTRSGKIIVLETKGDDRDNSDSRRKVHLGKEWSARSGDQYEYMMVFDQNPVEDAWSLSDFVEVMRRM